MEICIGDPQGIIRSVKEWESMGVDQVNCLVNTAEVLAQDEVLDSMRLFAREVMPAFGRVTPC